MPSAEVLFPELAQHLMSEWFFAIVFAAIISAIISTVAAVLFAAGSSLVEDLYTPFLRPRAKDKELIWIARLMTLAIALSALLLAFQGNASVFKLVSHAWAGLGAAFGPIILMSLFWSRMSYAGALLGMILGGSVTLLRIFCTYIFSAPIFGLYEIVPGFAAGLMGIFLGTYLKPQKNAIIMQMHTEYLKKLIAPEHRC